MNQQQIDEYHRIARRPGHAHESLHFLLHDRDAKDGQPFDAAFEAE